MKGKAIFSQEEAKLIEALIEEKLISDTQQQKSIRNKIRNLGFYASDFGIGNGYTVKDFRKVVSIRGQAKPSVSIKGEVRPPKVKTTALKNNTRTESDEAYVIDLCNEVLKQKALRQYRFDFLRGDSGVKLPVDAYYPDLNLVIEYRERQHTEEVKFFDKRITQSGVSRGEQRKQYDEKRRIEIPKNGLQLIEINYSDLEHTKSKRLMRNRETDLECIKEIFISNNLLN
jgi:hypothetical protein